MITRPTSTMLLVLERAKMIMKWMKMLTTLVAQIMLMSMLSLHKCRVLLWTMIYFDMNDGHYRKEYHPKGHWYNIRY